MAISDIFVFPSHREGFPNVVMQAGAMELPCIVTDINGCNEIVVDGVNGLIIPPKDGKALLEEYRSPEKSINHEFFGISKKKMYLCETETKTKKETSWHNTNPTSGY